LLDNVIEGASISLGKELNEEVIASDFLVETPSQKVSQISIQQ